MTIAASLIFLFAMVLCSLITISTLSASAHKIIDAIIDNNKADYEPIIRIGEIQYSSYNVKKHIDRNNMAEMPLILSRKQEIHNIGEPNTDASNWPKAA